MIYHYLCISCGAETERDFPFRKQPKKLKCTCGAFAPKIIRFPQTRVQQWPEWCIPSASDEMNASLKAAYQKQMYHGGTGNLHEN